MKALIGYGVFQKPDMYQWMISGVEENFPPETEIRFFLEAMRREDLDALENCGVEPERKDWTVYLAGHSLANILEHGVHRILIQQFMESDCDVLIIPHDDNRFERPLIPDLERLWEKYGTTLGWVSGRDGYGIGYGGMVRSPFSQSTGAKAEVLPIGEHREVLMMNTGPVVYFRHMVEKVGMPDADLPWFFWDDLCLRCHEAGLKNILLSMDCKHEKFGRVGHNPDLYNDELVASCLKKLNQRWAPVFGKNVL